MRFDLFQQMSPKEAAELLDQFLRNGRQILHESKVELTKMKLDQLAEELGNLASQTQFVGKSPDRNLPQFILDTAIYQDSLFEFAPESKRFVVFGAFVMGEWLVRSFNSLHWKTGDMSFATGAMPVVAGFGSKKEMPALLIAENLFRKSKQHPMASELFKKSLQRWVDNI
jgi:hypothetical protein